MACLQRMLQKQWRNILEKERNKRPIIKKYAESNTGIILLNTCTNCGEKFKPKNSMTYETFCNSCQEKTKFNQKE